MRDKRRDAARRNPAPAHAHAPAAAPAATIPPGDLGTLVYAPGGEEWAPDFTADGESRLLDLIDVDTTWDPRALAGATQETRVLCVATDGFTAGTGVAIAQIARTLARAGRDVLVVDASVATPFLTKPFQYQPDEGLVDMVLFGTSPGAAIRKTASDKIRVLTVGSPPIEAEEVWRAGELRDVLTAFRAEWDAIVVYTPLRRDDGDWCDVLRLADALLVVRPAASADVARVAKELAGLGAPPRLLGVVGTGRRGEVKPAPARKPAPSPAPAPAPSPVEERRPAAPPAKPEPVRDASPARPSAPSPAATPATLPDSVAPDSAPARGTLRPTRDERDGADDDFDGASSVAVDLDDHVEGGDRPAGRRGPSRVLLVALLLGVVALVGGAALGRFGGFRFGSLPAGEPPARARTPAQGAHGEPRVAPAEDFGDHRLSADAPPPQVAAADTAHSMVAAPNAPASERPDTSTAESAQSRQPQQQEPPRQKEPPPAPRETRAEAPPPPDAVAAEVWGVHVSSFPQHAMAARDSIAWRKKGYAVHVVQKEIPEKGLWYRIVLGEFAAKPEAQAFAEDVRAREGLDYGLVMKVPAR